MHSILSLHSIVHFELIAQVLITSDAKVRKAFSREKIVRRGRLLPEKTMQN